MSARLPLPAAASTRRDARHAALLVSVSLVAMFIANPQAYAKPMGSWTPSPSQAAIAAAQNGSQEAARAARQAQNSLKRATLAIQAMQATQAAARDAAKAALRAMPSGIPNGLGGLQIGGGVVTGVDANGKPVVDTKLWQGANLPAEFTEGDRTKVNIEQTQKNAVLTWQTYNVSENTDLRYDQKGNRDWIALNRVLDPNLAPSKILGTIKGDGTVLVINQNGIIFGAGAQINVGSLIASTLDVGPQLTTKYVNGTQQVVPADIAWRNQNFLQNGLFGYTDTSLGSFERSSHFSVLSGTANTGAIEVAAGASIRAGDGGLVLLTAPHVTNAGWISAPSGQVLLAATAGNLVLTPSAGKQGDVVPAFGALPDPDVRGLIPLVEGSTSVSDFYVWNRSGGLIEADRGNITLVSPNGIGFRGASYNDGILSSKTSVSRNGSIIMDGSDVRLGAGSLLSIQADTGGETIPQTPSLLAAFKPSAIKIGDGAVNVEMQADSFLYAPGANVQFGMSKPTGNAYFSLDQRILIQPGAEINVAGLTDVLVPATENEVVIDPAKKNELRDSPLYRNGFLNGSKIYLDPRESGVRDDGVAWIGSPLIDATAYYQLMGVSAERLMTRGGHVSFGPPSGTLNVYSETGTIRYDSPFVVVRDGAVINMSGGWVTYQAGMVRETRLVTADGHVVPISQATPDRVYVGVYGGWTRANARWGIRETWTNPFRTDSHYEPEYTEGRDAGTLRAAGHALVFDGDLLGSAYAGERQLRDSKTGTGKPSVAGDLRAVQGSFRELPAGGALIVNSIAPIDVAAAVSVAPGNAYENWMRGSIASDTGVYTPPAPQAGLSVPRPETVHLTDGLLSGSGLSQVSLKTVGKVTVEESASVSLNAGGVFSAVAGGRIEINGDITVRSGRIVLDNSASIGTSFRKDVLGDFDIVVNGDLSVAGRWINDYGNFTAHTEGRAWLNGGSISITAASNIRRFLDADGNPVEAPGGVALPDSPSLTYTAQDISGSILIGGRLNLSGGGRIDNAGKLDFSARGGNLTLKSDTAYYQTGGDLPGFRIISQANDDFGTLRVRINPDKINARIVFDPGKIKAHGFGGGGTFTLVTPEFAMGDGVATTGTIVPFGFFSSAGFANYDITSNKTEFTPSTFANGFGGFDSLLATQTVTVGAGQTLSLVQSVLPNVLTRAQYDVLRELASGGDASSLVPAIVPAESWDQRAVNLRLAGMLELHVERGGRVVGAAGSSITVGGLLNEGAIRIAGGVITQERILPVLYGVGIPGQNDAIGIRQLSDIFSIRPDGLIAPDAASVYDPSVTNQDLAGDFNSVGGVHAHGIYKLGVVNQDQGIVLATGSVTDLSGAVIINPYAVDRGGQPITTGTIIGGGTLQTRTTQQIGTTIGSPYQVGGTLVAHAGARIDLSGTAGVFDLPGVNGNLRPDHVPTPVWSNAGSLIAGAGGIFAGADIRALGGSAEAAGGTLRILNPVFAQHDPSSAAANVISADMILRAGFDTLVAFGDITSQGDATMKLGRAFFLQNRPWGAAENPSVSVISAGGALAIEAPYIRLQNAIDRAAPVTTGTPGTGSVILRGRQIDIAGAALFDNSVSRAVMEATGDIRLIGVAPWQPPSNASAAAPTLNGMIAVNGDLAMTAAQIYPTTGSVFSITSTAANGNIVFGRSGSATPASPYSAGGNLTVQAANIVQGGVIRVPFGTLTLGGNAAYTATLNGVATPVTFAPATQSVLLAGGSITSVSANGLAIPYGTTTDTKEWYFTPTGANQLSGPPVKVLSLNGSSVTLGAGATVDLSGGGDVYAYEFVPGTGGSRDVLDRFNADQYSANKVGGIGYQYPDARQVYAIVPGLSDASVAAFDPIYSADYAELQSASGAGKRVWLDAAPGLAAGWHTLLPARYAMLPGGMRVVEQEHSARPGVSARQVDGTLLVSGRYGDALSGSSQSQVRLFSVQPQSVIRSYSNIVLTSGNQLAISNAANNGLVTPRIGVDAGRLVLNPVNAMSIEATVLAAAASGGRGAQVDITGAKIAILSDGAGAPADGAIRLTAGNLNKLNAESLFIGGIRTDNADGTTSLLITTNSILVANDAAHPLIAPEIVLAVDDGLSGTVASSLALSDGASVIATGKLSDRRAGAYIIDGRLSSKNDGSQTVYGAPAQSAIGALLRVANGPERLVQRLRTPSSPTNPGSPEGLAASLSVGNVDLRGETIGLDTSHDVSIASAALLRGRAISLGATAMAFTAGGVAAGTVAITPELQAVLSQGQHLTLRSQTSIGFDDGSYSFGDTTLDAATLKSLQGGNVALGVSNLQLSNAGATGVAGAGTGTLAVRADELSIGAGTIATDGFGAVSLTAAKGVFAVGKDGVLDVGAAAFGVITPYIGDRAAAGTAAIGMTLKATGSVTITRAGTSAIDTSAIAGLPGSALTIEGNGITISGTHLRATAGSLTLKSGGGIALSDGVVLEAPGYEKTFGDAADPRVVSAPAGRMILTAQGAQGIALGDAILSVGGGQGNGGSLELSAPNGAVGWGTAVLNGRGGAGRQGGTFSLDTGGAIDLAALNDRVVANGFTTGFNLRTRTGDILLGANQILRSGSVNLTADGGFVTIEGMIDTSGINGGAIALYGKSGVTLAGTARLDSRASGYASDDTRKAKAGDITLGTDFTSSAVNPDGSVSGTSGVITVASGAVIDASARRPGSRLVRIMRNGTVNYAYVEGDEGGIVRFRAPVVGNGVSVNVAPEGRVIGARSIELEGFKRWDLAQVAASGNYTGVTRDADTNTITLDLRSGLDTANTDGTLTTVAGLNFLGDRGDGTIVKFVQDFALSGLDTKLGGLASQSNFHARPGVELGHSGDIILASNWNLGAGAVNVDAAKTAEVMKVDPISGQVYVVPGKEALLLADYTKMTYRVGGRVTGAAPLISLRAGGNLHLKGSVTDGFFQFRDQYDATYQSYVHGTSSSTMLGLLDYGIGGSAYVDWQTYTSDPNAFWTYYRSFFTNTELAHYIDSLPPGESGSGGATKIAIPFSAPGNSAAALGTGLDGAGDPLASAVVFPLLPNGQVVASSDYRLTTGADRGSVDPMRVASGSAGNLIIDGPKPQSMTVARAALPGGLFISLYDASYTPYGPTFRAGRAGFEQYMRNFMPGLSDDAVVSLAYLAEIPPNFQTFIDQELAADPNAHVKVWRAGNGDEVTISMALFAKFLEQYPDFGGGGGGGGGGDVTINLLPQTLVRTGTGSIRMAMAGNLDMRGSETPRYLNDDGTIAWGPNGGQLGGGAIYTAGRPAAPISEVLLDPVTGKKVTVATPAPAESVFFDPPTFYYGGNVERPDPAGMVIADALQLTGGGDISVKARGSVSSRRDVSLVRLANSVEDWSKAFPWAGRNGKYAFFVSMDGLSDDQPWRVNHVGLGGTSASINPQLFREGIGALGGGNVLVDAGATVSDLTAVSDTSLITGTATSAEGVVTRALITLGGGTVNLSARGDILAARVDAASGEAFLSAGGQIGRLKLQTGTNTLVYTDPNGGVHGVSMPVLLDNETRVRISDASVSLVAGTGIDIQGIRQLDGYYSDKSALNILANGSITVTNSDPMSPQNSSRIGSYAIYPGTLNVASTMGDVNLQSYAAPPGSGAPPAAEYNVTAPSAILMVPSSNGQLSILAGGNIAPTKIAMLDSDPNNLPGLFTLGGQILGRGVFGDTSEISYQFQFPSVISTTNEATLERQHNQDATHAGDSMPAYIYAGGDIGAAFSGVTLSLPKQARVYAGRDIVNMMFFGQNVAAGDLSRIVAGRDLVGTSMLLPSRIYTRDASGYLQFTEGPIQPVMLGNSIILGGPGDLVVEAGRNMGPFLNSAEIRNWNLDNDGLNRSAQGATVRFGQGIVTVGNDWNPYLPEQGANITVLFGASKGASYVALREAYVKPGSAANVLGGYGAKLVSWMQKEFPGALAAAFGTTDVTADQAYAIFLSLPELRQRLFLVNEVYFNELRAPADKAGPSYLKYSRGYAAVNTLFPASLGYTANGLEGGANDSAIVHTGDLDLRLAAIETVNGGTISILGPGGRVLAGSVVSTEQQAARRNYAGFGLHSPQHQNSADVSPIIAIPSGYEGVITQRGGAINTFTDGDFLLNQSRLFTVKGGDITMWSSNADLNAGQGAKTTPNFPPVEIRIGKNAYAEVDQAGATSGAGIAALPPGAGAEAPNVYLLAPRGAVDAGDAGVRSAGDLSVAALRVVNADNFKVGGTASGIPTVQAPSIGGLTEASNTAGAAAQQAATPNQGSGNTQPSIIIVEVLGFGGGTGEEQPDSEQRRSRGRQSSNSYDSNNVVRLLGNGTFTAEDTKPLTTSERDTLASQVVYPGVR